jgi:hypothetical protein
VARGDTVTRITVLAEDWELLDTPQGRGERPRSLEAIERGRSHLGEPAPGGDLRDRFVHLAASVAIYRFELASGRGRSHHAAEAERDTRERAVILDREVVPPLKLEARRLRAEIRRLEDELRKRGVDADVIEPRIDWSQTMAVDDYNEPRYQTVEERKRAAVEFFRRRGEGR